MKNKNNKPKYKPSFDRKDCYIHTQDDWCPNFPGDKVRLSVFPMYPDPVETYRVSVWGNDDMGMDLDFKHRLAAEAMYTLLKDQFEHTTVGVTVKDLKDLGFNYF